MTIQRFIDIAMAFFKYSFTDCESYADLTNAEQEIITEQEFKELRDLQNNIK